MSNHGYVKTKKPMTYIAVSKLFDSMNKDYFHNKLVIDHTRGGWGKHSWLVKYISDGKEYASRVMWLNNRNSFEMRHGGGSDFAWWIDSAILNEVACSFQGSVTDDGVGGRIPKKAGKYKDFWEFKEKMHSHGKEDIVRKYFMQLEQKEGFIPPEFHKDLGPEILLKYKYEDGSESNEVNENKILEGGVSVEFSYAEQKD